MRKPLIKKMIKNSLIKNFKIYNNLNMKKILRLRLHNRFKIMLKKRKK